MNILLITPLIGSIFALSLGFFVLFNKPRSSINQVFALFCFETFVWQFCWLISYFLVGSIAKDFIARIAFSSVLFVPLTYYHLAIIFLKLSPRKNQIWITYSFGFIFFILLWASNLFIAGYRDFWWGYYPKVGPIFFVYLIGVFFYMMRALILILRAAKDKNYSASEHNKIKFIALAYFLFFFATIEYAIDYGFPLYPIGAFFIIGAWLVIALAILRHRLMDIRIVINRTVAWMATIVLLGSIYLCLVWLYQIYVGPQMGWIFLSGTILYGILVGVTFLRIGMFFQTTVERKFMKDFYAFPMAIMEINDKLASSINAGDAVSLVKIILNKYLKLNSIDVLEWREGEYLVVGRNILIPSDYLLIQLLAKTKNLLFIEDLSTEQKKVIQTHEFLKDKQVFLPCSLGEEIKVIFCVGQKASGEVFTDTDIKLFKAVASQMNIVLDRARLHEEMLNAQKQLLMADKLSAFGKVAAGLAHEIKNPLTAIKGMTQALERNPGDQETIRDFNAIIPKEVDRLTRLVENLSNLGKAPKFQFAKTNLNLLIENNLKLFEGRCRKQGINIVKEFRTIPEIETDGERLTQVFTNLILNAIQAMPDGGMLTIQTNQQTNITIEISDTGHGIPEDKIKDIFEPFFTTKEEGTGLGLAITHKIIKDLGGEIIVESKAGEGAKFKITLPLKCRGRFEREPISAVRMEAGRKTTI